jgi:hypothetical protein
VIITLSSEEVARAEAEGRIRGNNARKRKGAHKYGANAPAMAFHPMGAIAECAVAKHFGVAWDEGALGAADVGANIEVRTTHYPRGKLILHKDDKPNSPYVLVTGVAPTLTIQGWIMGRDGMTFKYWGDAFRTGRPCFAIPQIDLNPIESLNADGTENTP